MPEQLFDATDRAIVGHLQRDGRMSNVDLADAVSLSPSACLRRVKALEAAGVISGYRAEVDRERVGQNLTVFVTLRVDQHSRERSRQFEQALMALPNVVACHLVSGEYDFLLEAVLPDLRAYERVLLDGILAVEGIRDARSTFVLRTVASRAPVPLDQLRS